MSEEEQEKIREANEKIKKEREAKADVVATRYAVFKRDFVSAPIRKAMNAVLAGKGDTVKPCQIDYRSNESFFVFPSKTDVSVTLEVDFASQEDKAMARIFLLELKDCKRAVKNAPGVMFHDKQPPQTVVKAFPKALHDTSNGAVTLSVNTEHLKKGIEEPLTQLIGFRQFLHFNMHGIKIQLHSTMRRRVETIELIIKKARRDEEAPKVFKEKHGGE